MAFAVDVLLADVVLLECLLHDLVERTQIDVGHSDPTSEPMEHCKKVTLTSE